MNTRWVKIIWVDIHGNTDGMAVERDELTNWEWLQQLEGGAILDIEGWSLDSFHGHRLQKAVRLSLEFIGQLEVLDARDWEDFNAEDTFII